MKKKAFIFVILSGALALGFIFSLGYQAGAVDRTAPHDFDNKTFTESAGCTGKCHALHNAQGQSLNNALGNVDLCITCHTTALNTFDLPANNPTVPGVVGIHHQYNVPYTNLSSSDPRPYFTFAVIENSDKIVCSTCHQVHATDIDRQGQRGAHTGINQGFQKTSVPPGGVAAGDPSKVTKTVPVAGTGGQMYLRTVSSSADTRSYRVKIVLAGAVGVAAFIVYSEDPADDTIFPALKWWNWNGSQWIIGTSSGPGRATGLNVAVDNTGNVTVDFSDASGTFAVNDEWKTFYVSYPFLRAPLDSGDNTNGAKFCRNCHGNRTDTVQNVEGANPGKPADGTNKFSHPVGAALSKSYDRAANAILDANGATQTVGDTNSTNDLRLAPVDSTVQCYTCHKIHYGNSNSLP